MTKRNRYNAHQRDQFRRNTLVEMERAGHTIVQFTPYHYRIDGVLDVYPTSQTYRLLKGNKKGNYRYSGDLKQLLAKGWCAESSKL